MPRHLLPVVRIPMKEEVTEETVVEAVPEEPKEPVEILRAPTFKDPAMTASSRPRVKKAATEEKTCQTHSRQSGQGRFRRTEESDRCQENND